MWSVKQYRQIGTNVTRESRKEPENGNGHTGTHELGLPSQKAKQNEKSSLSEVNTPSPSARSDDDEKVWVRTEGEHDPIDPRNWSLMARIKNIAILCLLIFGQGWAGAAESMANTAITEQFGVSKVAANLTTAMYLFGIGSGALVAGPLSETVGRNPVYLGATLCYLFFVLGCALTPTFAGLIVCRYFVGLFASATLSINGSSVRDQFRPVKRAFAFPVIAWANVAGMPSKQYGLFAVTNPRHSTCHCTHSRWLDCIEP